MCTAALIRIQRMTCYKDIESGCNRYRTESSEKYIDTDDAQATGRNEEYCTVATVVDATVQLETEFLPRRCSKSIQLPCLVERVIAYVQRTRLTLLPSLEGSSASPQAEASNPTANLFNYKVSSSRHARFKTARTMKACSHDSNHEVTNSAPHH